VWFLGTNLKRINTPIWDKVQIAPKNPKKPVVFTKETLDSIGFRV
jgi:hypothetical protein